ncbi:MAG: PaaI family thioesterase [Desulfarculus sp.]|nr:MAG: PaaI family thioesterase [Desulfarculus sp.]
MKRINPQWLELVRTVRQQDTYFRLLGMDITDLGWGRARLELEVGPQHLQPYGAVHGGVISSLVDSAGFWAVYSMVPEGQEATTVEMKLNYLAPVRSGRLAVEGRCLKLGRTLGLAEAQVQSQEGEMVAHGTVTMMLLPAPGWARPASLPPKHLED